MFSVISGQTLTMFLMIVLGYGIFRAGLVDHAGNKAISDILLLVVTPCMILQNFSTSPYDPARVRSFLLAIALGFAAHFVMILISSIFLRGDSGKNADLGIERYLAVYSNCGFMGIPIVSAVFGGEGVLYVTAYMVSFNVLTWTHGLSEITGKRSLKQLGKGLCSSVVLSIAAGLAIYLLRIPVESHVKSALSYVGGMNTPLGMFVAGCALGETNLLAALKKKRLYLVTVLKLLAGPAAVFAVFLALRLIFTIPDTVFFTILIAAACPCGTTGTMFALRYNRDYEHSSQIFVVSTLPSMFTIPVFVSLAKMIAGIM